MLKTSTEIGSGTKRIGAEKAIEYIAKSGFTAWDFSMVDMCGYDWKNQCVVEGASPLLKSNYLSYVRMLRRIGEDNGIICNQSHAPTPLSPLPMRPYLKRAIECTAEAGGKICVIHPDNSKTVEENVELFNELLSFAKECNVKIATENMWNWDTEKNQATFAACSTPENFYAHVKAMNDEAFVACLDIGHAEMKGLNSSAVSMIEVLGDKLQALHIHDNDKWHDCHQIPFSMGIDFYKVAQALKKIGYSGFYTLEAYNYLNAFSGEEIFNGYKNLFNAVKRVAELAR